MPDKIPLFDSYFLAILTPLLFLHILELLCYWLKSMNFSLILFLLGSCLWPYFSTLLLLFSQWYALEFISCKRESNSNGLSGKLVFLFVELSVHRWDRIKDWLVYWFNMSCRIEVLSTFVLLSTSYLHPRSGSHQAIGWPPGRTSSVCSFVNLFPEKETSEAS